MIRKLIFVLVLVIFIFVILIIYKAIVLFYGRTKPLDSVYYSGVSE